MTTIITKNSSTASSVPTAAQLVKGELAVNVTDKRLFTEDNSGNIVELGTNPSTFSLPNGTANAVPYLNGSKVLTTGSALTFDGTTLSVPAGSAVAPSVATTGDTNTGVFFPAADTVALATGGSERVRITSGGALLVGNTSAISSEKIQTLNTNSGAVTLAARFINGGTATSTGSRIAFSGNIGSAGSFDDIALIDGVATGTSAGALVFRTNNSGSFDERARFNATGALVLQGGNTSANGVGITFPATQSASTDANTLDDYEEGTWTPAVSFSGGNGDTSYTVRYGSYTKVGRMVTCTAYIWFSESTASGNLSVTGLPFTSVGGGTYGYNWYGIVGSNSLTGYTNYFLQVNGGFGGGTTTAAVLGNSGTQLTNANTGANTVFVFSVTYEAA